MRPSRQAGRLPLTMRCACVRLQLDYSRFSTRVGLFPRYRTTRAYSWEFTGEPLSLERRGRRLLYELPC